jgi:CheY-like chemotaxis protein/cytidylate kinase
VAVITIFSGSHCGGEEIAETVATFLGYRQVGEDLLDTAAGRFGVPAAQLARAMDGPPPFLSRLTHEREKNVAFLRAAMADLVRQDKVLYHGFAGHLVPSSISHVLKVCVIANLDFRVATAAGRSGVTEKQALREIHKDDGRRLRWTRSLHGRDPYDESLYDVLLAMQSTTVDKAAASLCEIALGAELQVTPESLQAADDFALASRVEIELAPKGYDIGVHSSQGEVTITLNRYVTRIETAKRQLEGVAAKVPGVRSVRCLPGAGFVPPSLIGPSDDLAGPSKILLVDDEREFVHTLSERLQTRNLDAAVVYDGEEALSFVASDEPEVMVLDLKMPGIDGIEVLRRVKRDHPAVEVIILTGHGSKKEEEEAERLGAFAYLRKPVDIDLLTTTMKKAYNKIGRRPPSEDPGSEG